MKSPELQNLIQLLAKLPGLGPRSGRRAALYLVKHRDSLMGSLVQAMQEVAQRLQTCSVCGNLDTCTPCSICSDMRRDGSAICVVETVSDIWALERTTAFRGHYHVLGGLLSAIHGAMPQNLGLTSLVKRVAQGGIREVILALSATAEGMTTVHYIMDALKVYGVAVTALAHGIPVGGELDYLDDGTIQAAFSARRPYS